jgi:phage protein D
MVYPVWYGGQQSDLDLILMLAERYGKDVYCYDNKVYVTGLMMFRKDIIIYEWGKNIISFRGKEDISKQISKQKMIAWNVQKAQSIKVEKTIDDIDTKIGGNNSWMKASNGGGGKWVDVRRIRGKTDIDDAWQQAKGRLQKLSFDYLRMEASGEGNNKLFAGMTVTMKNIGKRYSGEYLTEWVAHEFSMDDGYITEFGLKRNMLNDDNLPRKPVIEKYAVVNNDNKGTRNKVQGTREDRMSR